VEHEKHPGARENHAMTIILVGVGIVVVLAVGVGAMLYNDHKQHKRMIENGGQRF
jgi:hypothetical protein